MDQKIAQQDISRIPLFFIIGRPRSGTTLLRVLLEAHPEVTIPPESPFILFLYKKYHRAIFRDEALIREFAEDVYHQRYFDKWLIPKDELIESLMQVKGETDFGTMVRKVCLCYPSVFDKKEIRLIGDKNPANSLYVQRIHQLFPDSKMIHITRDYRDNYLSLTDVNFEVPLVPLVIFRWKFAWKRMQKLKLQHPDLVYSLRYEDLAMNPEEEMRKVCKFLDIAFDPGVFSFYEKKDEMEKAYAGSKELSIVHKSLLKPVSTDRLDLWKTRMTDRQVRMADLVAGKVAGKAGYIRKYDHFDLGLMISISPLLVYGWIMYRLLLLGDRLPHRWRKRLNEFLGIFLKIYWRLNRRKVKPL